ncbi:HAD family hydrolase [Flexivirga caeni]|uniref:HAD family hydrolase n=1 Tax=Flexivirga caeni TaxID=2294115 RepID=A0A3M9MCP4_9MICO|nr:HAD family hydrolase [Flexivirga caeni]RNI23294.1 HAD family hydrolase [Flexivirga caeni]
MTVRAVIFDWGGTLTPWHDIDFDAEAMSYAAAYGDPSLAGRLLDATAVAWGRAREHHTSARLAEILTDAGADLASEQHRAGLAAYRDYWEPHTFADPQVRQTWEGLRESGIRVGVLSNTIWERDYHRGLFERDGLLDLIDGDVYSSEIAWAKPHAEAFRAAAAAVDVDPAECVYVGDRLFEDVHGPQQVGMRAIWIPHSVLPEAQVVPTEATPDAVAHELLDVLHVVRGWAG